MATEGSIFSGIFKYSISSWINIIVGFLSVIITTRILTPEVYGLTNLFLSSSSLLMYVLMLGLDGAYIRFYNEPPAGDSRNQLLYKIICYSVLFSIAAGVGVTFWGGEKFSDYVFGFSSRLIVGVIFINALSQIILRYFNISFRMSFRAKQYTIQNVLMTCLSRVLLICAALIHNNTTFIVTFLTLGLLVTTIIYAVIQRKEFIPLAEDGRINLSLSLKGYGDYLKFALFSAPTYIVTYFNQYYSQQLIRSLIGAYALGIFSSSGIFGTLLMALKGGFGTYWAAYVYKNHDTEHDRIIKMHDYVMLFAIFILSLMIIFRDVIYLFIGSEFHESKVFFSLLLSLPILTFLQESTDKGIALAKKNHISLIIHILSVLVNIGGCLLLIPKIGLMGAALASALSALSLYTLCTIYGQKYYKSIKSIGKSLIGLAILLSLLVFPAIVHDIKWIILFSLAIDLLSIIIYREEFIHFKDVIIGILKTRKI